MNIKIPRCYDSHCHLLAWGVWQSSINLSQINLIDFDDLESLEQIVTKNHLAKFSPNGNAHGNVHAKANANLKDNSKVKSNSNLDYNLSLNNKVPSDNKFISDNKSQSIKFAHGFSLISEEYKNISFYEKMKNQLNHLSPQKPLLISSKDGHTIWVNQALILWLFNSHKTSGWLPSELSDFVPTDSEGNTYGVFYEKALFWLWDQCFKKMPVADIEHYLLAAQNSYLENGFTHVRDMSGTSYQWEALKNLVNQKRWHLFLEENFEVHHLNQLEGVLKYIKDNQPSSLKQKVLHSESNENIEDIYSIQHNQSKVTKDQIRIKGIKIYLDGTLTQQTAAVTHNKSCRHAPSLLWPESDLAQLFQTVWGLGLEVSVHAIGDQALELLTQVSQKIAKKFPLGVINIEHALVANQELMRAWSSYPIVLHFQPSHWPSDFKNAQNWWPKNLKAQFYPFEQARRLGLTYYFGSDAPISPPGLKKTYQALKKINKQAYKQKKKAVKTHAYKGLWWAPHSHPDPDWGGECYTIIKLKPFKIVKVQTSSPS